MKYEGQQIVVLGGGTSGLAASRLARALGASVVLVDSGESDVLRERTASLVVEGIEVKLGADAFVSDPNRFSFAVVSPGIDPLWDLTRHFSDADVELWSEIEFGYQNTSTPVVAITGTNGKSTTTELAAVILNAAGQKTVPAGNYGLAFCDILLGGEAYDVHMLEVSSFQLELIKNFRPTTSVWMNFAPDHLDRHVKLEAYRAAKLRVFENQTEEDTAVLNAADPVEGIQARTVTFSAFGAEADYTLEGHTICFKGEPVADFTRTNLRGAHNAENLMAAMAVARSRGIEFSEMEEAIRAYRPPRHRCELVAIVGDVEYINDSKSTNLHSLESSLRSLRHPLILIAGGKDKGLDFGGVRESVREACSHVVAIGEIAQHLVDSWGDVVRCEIATDMADAIERAQARASQKQIVLLSPGTSSFDMFSGYQERGESFCNNVKRLL